MPDNPYIRQTHCRLEEDITTGGVDLSIIPEDIQKYSQTLLENRKKKIEFINNNIQKIEKEDIKSLIKQYNLGYKKTRLFSNGSYKDYINKVVHTFTETSFSKAFNLPHRLCYSQYNLDHYFLINVQDDKEYSITNGLSRNLVYYNEDFKPMLHPNTYAEGLNLLESIEMKLSPWDYNCSNAVKKVILTLDKETKISNTSNILVTPIATNQAVLLDSSNNFIVYSVKVPNKIIAQNVKRKAKKVIVLLV